MPTYEYRCGSCGVVHTARRRVEERARPSPCPACDAAAGVIWSVPRVRNGTASRDSLVSWGRHERPVTVRKDEFLAEVRRERREEGG